MTGEMLSSGEDSAGIDLRRLLASIQRGGARYPESWDRVVTFTSRKSPHEIDARKFDEFRRALFERAGIELKLVGAKYGCTDLFFEVSVPDPSKVDQTYGIRTNIADPAEIRAMLTAVLQHDAHLRSLAVAAGFPTLRGSVNLDLSSNGVSPGTAPEITYQANTTHNTFNAPVGVVSDKAKVKKISVSEQKSPGRRSDGSNAEPARERNQKP